MLCSAAQETLQLRLELYINCASCMWWAPWEPYTAGALERQSCHVQSCTLIAQNFGAIRIAILLAFHPCTHCHAGGSQHSKSFWYIEHAGRRTHSRTRTLLLMKGCQLMSHTANPPPPYTSLGIMCVFCPKCCYSWLLAALKSPTVLFCCLSG